MLDLKKTTLAVLKPLQKRTLYSNMFNLDSSGSSSPQQEEFNCNPGNRNSNNIDDGCHTLSGCVVISSETQNKYYVI